MQALRLRICTDSIFVTNQVFLFSVYARVLYFTHVCHDGEWDVVPQLHACTRTVNDIIASYRNYKSCVRNYKRFYEDTCA